jgi:hypothetical protein
MDARREVRKPPTGFGSIKRFDLSPIVDHHDSAADCCLSRRTYKAPEHGVLVVEDFIKPISKRVLVSIEYCSYRSWSWIHHRLYIIYGHGRCTRNEDHDDGIFLS